MANKKNEEQNEMQFWKAVGISMIIIDFILFVIVLGLAMDSRVDSDMDIAGEVVASDVDNNDVDETNSMAQIDDPVLGDVNAPVTLYVYSDFECPYCERFYNGAYKQIKDEYVESGEVKIVFKDFPLTRIHPNAMKASEAMQCANEQGLAFEMHDKIFDEGGPTVELLKLWAVELGLDSEAFDECLDSDKYEQEVLDDIAEGANMGVSGTPTVFVNEEKLVGAQPFSAFEKVIEEELEKLS